MQLEPVFTTMLEKAVRICDASFGNIFRWDGEFLNHIAAYNTPVAFLELRRHQRISFSPEDPVGRMVANKNVVHTADLAEERGYVERSNPGDSCCRRTRRHSDARGGPYAERR